ncbi:hypothetical protein U9M48_024949 [Paspalum notatum var. saurae]|uniref:Uncharacterized protein n=1 Tax=Paspalum notatum var. saurae TaxID=547442 RepID=A0AAQ3TS90_PASNO
MFARHACAWDATPQDVRHSGASADARHSGGQRRPRCTPALATPNRRTPCATAYACLRQLAAPHPSGWAHATPCDHRSPCNDLRPTPGVAGDLHHPMSDSPRTQPRHLAIRLPAPPSAIRRVDAASSGG